jgi:signal transduction histidine kinase
MNSRNCLVLAQYRKGDKYNDFIGKYYHFPATTEKNYSNFFKDLPIEFVYYEPEKKGKGEFYGYGTIVKPPFRDKRDNSYCFVEIEEYRPFSIPISYKDTKGKILEQIYALDLYNPQNAVRKTVPEFIENICLDGGITMYFKTDAHLIRILGEQLIGSEKVGILELIKNSIDANAGYCRVRIERVPELEPIDDSCYEYNELTGPVIVIEDDGIGMNKRILEDGWLRPASTIKTLIKEKMRLEREKAEKEGKLGTYDALIALIKKEHGGRIPLGEKGVGRFATHRLGRLLTITTKTKEMPYELLLKIDWHDFDKHIGQKKDLESIGVILTRQNPSRDYGEKNSGTRIIISGGRKGFTWNKRTIKDINKSILRLNSPNPNPKNIKSDFKAYLECPQIDDLEQSQVYETFEPNFSFDALIDKDGFIDEYSLKFNPPTQVPLVPEVWREKNVDLKVDTYWKQSDGTIRKPVCGPFFVHLDVWYRKTPWIDGPDAKEMKDYLDDYGGISIYRDNVIISPSETGKKHDWLNLTGRHIKQGSRVSYYNMIGNLEIEQAENLELIDKTGREGMLETLPFKDLATLVGTIIQNIVEIRFKGKRDELTNLTTGLVRDPKKLADIAKQSSLIFQGVRENYELEHDPWHILERLGRNASERQEGLINLENSIKTLKKSIKVFEVIQEKFTEQAGFGIAVAVSLHELNKIASHFYNGISNIIKSGKFDELKLEHLKEASDSLKSELKRLGPLRSIRNEVRREFTIVRSINYAYEIFRSKLEKEKISFEVNSEEDFPLYARYSALNQIIANLFDNSLYWLGNFDTLNKRIRVQLSKENRTLIFADTGPGIALSIQPYLFQPGYSTRIPPSGLGLYICKSYMHSMKGDIHETNNRERIKDFRGAQFTLEFEKVPISKELV